VIINSLIDSFALRQDGSKPLTADWDAGPYKLTAGTLTDGTLSISDGSITSGVEATFSGTLQAEHLYSTDDLQVNDDATIEGLGTLGNLIVGTSTLVVNRTGYGGNVGIRTLTPTHNLELLGDAYFQGPTEIGEDAPTAFEVIGGTGADLHKGGPIYIRGGVGGVGVWDAAPGAGGAVGLYGGDGGIGYADEEASGTGGNIILAPGSAGAVVYGESGADGRIDIQGDIDLNTNTLIVPSGGGITIASRRPPGGTLKFDFAAADYEFVERSSLLGIRNVTSGREAILEFFSQDDNTEDNVGLNIWGRGTPDQTTNRERFLVRYNGDATNPYCEITSAKGGTGTVRPIKLCTGANTDQLVLLTTGNNTMSGNLDVAGHYEIDSVQVIGNRVIDARCDDAVNSGDATTDGVIDALRDAMITHGLIAAT